MGLLCMHWGLAAERLNNVQGTGYLGVNAHVLGNDLLKKQSDEYWVPRIYYTWTED